MSQFRKILIALLVVFFFGAGYLGYLAALVDQEEAAFFAEVEASTDLERLQQQLARAKSIADARRRAYERRRADFIALQQKLLTESDDTVPADMDGASGIMTDPSAQVTLVEVQRLQKSLDEEEQDLQFFDDQVEVVSQILDRQQLEEQYEQEAPRQLPRKVRLTQNWQRLRQLLDKQKQLSASRDEARKTYTFWEKNPKTVTGDLSITVNDKSGAARSLDPQHTSQVATALSIMPGGFDQRIQRLYIVYGDEKMRRGMSGVGVVFMKGEEIDFFRVLVHEFGHIWDLHREVIDGEKSQFFDGSYRLVQQDPSVTYYEITWKNNFEKTDDSLGFVSGYGTSDPFEDFAEAYAFFVLQHRAFERWSQESPSIARKYEYLSRVFSGRKFPSTEVYSARPYDVTMLPVNYEKLLTP